LILSSCKSNGKLNNKSIPEMHHYNLMPMVMLCNKTSIPKQFYLNSGVETPVSCLIRPRRRFLEHLYYNLNLLLNKQTGDITVSKKGEVSMLPKQLFISFQLKELAVFYISNQNTKIVSLPPLPAATRVQKFFCLSDNFCFGFYSSVCKHIIKYSQAVSGFTVYK